MRDYHVVSFSGGKDSTAMLLHMLELGMPIDDIIFVDTSIEFPKMYEHINKVEQYIGRKITRLKAEYDFEYYLLEAPPMGIKAKQRALEKNCSGIGFPMGLTRWCTFTLKTNIVRKYFNQFRDRNIIQYVGIAYDEPKRIKDKTYPLVEWKWTEKDCLDYCYNKGFDFGGLYNYFDRVSCWCCYMQSLQDLRMLREHFPDLWNKLKDWENKSWNNFRHDYTIPQLEIRFDLEKEWEEKGLKPSMRNKEFKNEYLRRIQR